LKNKISIVLVLFFVVFSVKSQNNITKKKPKIGLVLSGGGAKALAHIGVLKVVDSLGIKVDYIAGTSMGAILGALYASGYSGKAIDSICRGINFDEVLKDELPRASKELHERSNAEKYAVTLPFDNFKVKFPSALSKGQNTFNLISKLTLHVNHIKDFSKLPIPFFCMATDIETGKQVLLDQGNLNEAIMASGALPTLFQPVFIKDKILIDGGVVNNYPIEELRSKGVDVVIGVDVQDDLLTRDELTSATDLLFQINNLKAIKDMTPKVSKTDIYIKPDITNYSVVSFGQGDEIVKKGKHAALLKIGQLKDLTTGISIKKNKIVQPDSLTIKQIKLSGTNKYTRSYVLRKLKLKPNTKVSYKGFTKGVNNLMATNNFKSFYYQLEHTPQEGAYHLVANIREVKTNTFLKLGVHYDRLYKSAAVINLTRKHLFFKDDEASLDFILGDNLRYNFEYLINQGQRWNLGFKSRYNAFNKNVNPTLFLSGGPSGNAITLNRINAKIEDQTNQVFVETLLKKDFSLSFGLEHKRLKIKSETITLNTTEADNFIFDNTSYFSLYTQLKLDSYDNTHYPSSGTFVSGDLHSYLYASSFNTNFESFSILKAQVGKAYRLSSKLAFKAEVSGGFKIGDLSTNSLDFTLGGYGNNLINNYMSFIGYDFLSLTGDSFFKTLVRLDYQVLPKHHILFKTNFANVGDGLFKSGDFFSLPKHQGYGLGYGLETLIGPIELNYSYSPENKDSVWFFNLGFWF